MPIICILQEMATVRSQLDILVNQSRSECRAERSGRPPPTSAAAAYPDEKKQRELLVNLSKSVVELLDLPFVNFAFKPSEDRARLLCKFCHVEAKLKDGLTMPESDTDDKGNQTRRFINLKHSVIVHLNSKSHQENSTVAADDKRWTAHASSRNTQAQMNIGRLYYVGIKHQDSYRSMEDRIAAAKAMGVEVGEVRHSRHHAADFVATAYKVLVEAFQEYFVEMSDKLGFPLPFGITADKDTSKHRSRQVDTN